MGGEDKKKSHVGRTTHLEFGGYLGSLSMVLSLPLTVFGINLACGKPTCGLQSLYDVPLKLRDHLYVDPDATKIFLGWFVFQIILSLVPVGTVVEGLPLRTGKTLKYRCNAFFAFVVSILGFGALVYFGYPVTVIYHKFLPLATVAILFSAILSVFLYVRSFFVPNHALAEGGNSGFPPYDFFIGRELNPRLGPIDLKFFCELRPGLIGWAMLDLAFIVEQYQQGSLSAVLLIAALFQILYVADALWNEEAILTTMDIVHDGFGFMLVFGDLVWVPFLYCLQVRFLLEHPQIWSTVALVAIVLLNGVGYLIFRKSNSQKNAFRKNPQDPTLAHLETLSTSAGKRLLVSGWWGLCRHPNYLGDLIMALAWSLPCGFQHVLPYFYPIYFLGLLVHRSMRDDASCRKKYGADWVRYCEKVPYRIFPYIY